MELVRSNCSVCHATILITSQPPLSSEVWHAEVYKMNEKYGATFISDENADRIGFCWRIPRMARTMRNAASSRDSRGSAETARIARAAFPKGAPFLRLRDELGVFLIDQDFAYLYPQRGQPAAAPWRLMLISVMQYAENLTDRQAADAVRGHLAWKYALSLELDDPGLDASVLCEFRTRLLAAPEPLSWLDQLLSLCVDRGLLQRHGKQRTDSTHVLAAIRVMNRLELVTECLRAALNALATFAPDWLREVADPEWYDRYGHRMENYRFPKSDQAKQVYADQVGKDGQTLLTLIARDGAPQGSQHLAEVLKSGTLLATPICRSGWHCPVPSAERIGQGPGDASGIA